MPFWWIVLVVLCFVGIVAGVLVLMESLSGKGKLAILGLALILVSWGGICRLSDVQEESRIARLKEISGNPKAWVADQKAESVPVALALVDAKVAELAELLGRTKDNPERRRAIGDAIDALSRERECLARLRSPAKCE